MSKALTGAFALEPLSLFYVNVRGLAEAFNSKILMILVGATDFEEMSLWQKCATWLIIILEFVIVINVLFFLFLIVMSFYTLYSWSHWDWQGIKLTWGVLSQISLFGLLYDLFKSM